LVISLFEEGVELVFLLLQVPVLVYSSNEGRVSLIAESLVNPLLEGLVRAEEISLRAREGSLGEKDWSGSKETGVDRLSFA
jgi:hypothetical protein